MVERSSRGIRSGGPGAGPRSLGEILAGAMAARPAAMLVNWVKGSSPEQLLELAREIQEMDFIIAERIEEALVIAKAELPSSRTETEDG